MQRFWRVVQEKGVVTEKQGAVIRQRLRHPGKSLRAIGKDLARYGLTNGGGAPIHPYQLKEMVNEGVARLNAYLTDRPLEETRSRVGLLLREKVTYSRSTKKNPYLGTRLGWWQFRKTGKKWNGSKYDRRTK